MAIGEEGEGYTTRVHLTDQLQFATKMVRSPLLKKRTSCSILLGLSHSKLFRIIFTFDKEFSVLPSFFPLISTLSGQSSGGPGLACPVQNATQTPRMINKS